MRPVGMANSIVAPQWSDIDDDALTPPSELKPVFVSAVAHTIC
jgi:hypothetical protein